ncbi:hypothetical protein C4J81_15505 [Deltaproteobacteria bacterium Smac51]|nr:hypothetical protein C4J81_15505 [Deltaproteobacteria bacterium Smac51]
MRVYTGKHGAGRDRDYHAIKKWLDENCITVKQVAVSVGLDPTAASQTIRGVSNRRKILWRLVELGCPHDILSLPTDMEEAVNAENQA